LNDPDAAYELKLMAAIDRIHTSYKDLSLEMLRTYKDRSNLYREILRLESLLTKHGIPF
jgi:hypothetical protein